MHPNPPVSPFVYHKQSQFLKVDNQNTLPDADDLIQMDLPTISPDFIKREELLQDLENNLFPHDWNTNSFTIFKILHGMSGIGKTELALAFANKNKNLFSFIWFIPFGTRGVYENSYRELADALNIPHQNKSISDLVKEVHERLENRLDANKPWLLIFDNVCEMQNNNRLPQNGGCILMTTVNPDIWFNQNHHMKIPGFSYKDAAMHLKQIKNSMPYNEVTELIDELNGHPILIDAAKRSIGSYENIEEYLSQIRAVPKMKQATRYPKTMGPVFYLLFEQIKKKSSLAFEFLEILAFLNPDSISVDFFDFWLNEKQATLEKAHILKTLTEEGMIRLDEVKMRFSIHRLQQQVIQAISKEEKYKEVLGYLAKWSKGFSVNKPKTYQIALECFLQISRRSDDLFWKKNIEVTNQVQILSVCESWMEKVVGDKISALHIQEKKQAIQTTSEPKVEELPQVELNVARVVELNNHGNDWLSQSRILFGSAAVLATLAASYFYSKLKE